MDIMYQITNDIITNLPLIAQLITGGITIHLTANISRSLKNKKRNWSL